MPAAMGPVSASIAVDSPRERVFDLACDLANRPAFTDHFQWEYRLEGLDSAGVDAAARFRVGAPFFAMWMETVIAEAERPHLIVERGRGGRSDRIAAFTVWEMVSGPGAVTTVSIAFWTEPSHPLDRLREHLGSTRFYRRQWRIALERMRDLLESGAEVPRVGAAGGNRHPTGVL
jgi:hypothetical protein